MLEDNEQNQEILAIFNEQYEKIGEKNRVAVHEDSDWHETFQCWFIEEHSNEYYVYFQKRAATKNTYPNMYDYTCAGHIMADETLMQGGLRELQEELGITLNEQDLQYAGYFKWKDKKDLEFCHQYIYMVQSIEFHLGEEVSEIVRVREDDFHELMNDRIQEITGVVVTEEKIVTMKKEDFRPHLYEDYQYTVKWLHRS